MSKQPSSRFGVDPNSLLEVKRRQLAEKLGYLLAREWLGRRAQSHLTLVNSSPSDGGSDGKTSDHAASAGQVQMAPWPTKR